MGGAADRLCRLAWGRSDHRETGEPGKPTTQRKNERFHQTLFRWLDKQPLAGSIAELQEQVDRFDVIYNTERPHQDLPGRVTPQAAWDATEAAEPPRPRLTLAQPILLDPAGKAPGTPLDLEHLRAMRVQSSGYVRVRGVTYQIARELGGHTVYVAERSEGAQFCDDTGTLLLEHPWPEPAPNTSATAGTARPKNIRDVIHSTGTMTPPGEHQRTVRRDGRVSVRNVVYGIGRNHTGTELHVIVGEKTVTFWSTHTGELIAQHQLPNPASNTSSTSATTALRKPTCPRCLNTSTVHDVLIQNCPRCPETSYFSSV